MRTKIYTTKKLAKLAKKLIKSDNSSSCGKLGEWNAALFYVDRKKCWLLSNKKTQYNFILTDIKAKDLDGIEDLFKNAFYAQLIYDGIIIDFDFLHTLIGALDFLPTDNDRKTTGFQNHRIQELNWWNIEFGGLINMPINDLTNRINNSPIHIGTGKKFSDFTDSISEMKKVLSE